MISVLVSSLYSIIAFQGDLIQYVDLDFAHASGWTQEARGTRQATYRRSIDRASFWVSSGWLRADRDLDKAWKLYTMTAEPRRHKSNVGPSGYQIGEATEYWIGNGGVTVKARQSRYLVTVQVTYAGTGERGRVRWQKADPEGDIERVEGGVRHAIARLQAAGFTTGSNATINGTTISGNLRDTSGKLYAPIAAWANARGVAINKNVRLGTVSFVVNGRTVILALATDQAKIGSDWRSLGTMVVRKGSEWYVPLNGIETLTR